MTQYVSRFIPKYATTTAPMGLLTRQDTPWKCEQKEQKALEELKEALHGRRRSHFILRFTKANRNHCWCKPRWTWWFIGTRRQNCQLCGSGVKGSWKSLLPNRARDACCSVGCKTFPCLCYGTQFFIITAHKPLIGIFTNHKQTSARIERWKLRFMLYDCKLIYRPGKDAENPADFMSRHPSPSQILNYRTWLKTMFIICARMQ